MSTWVTDRLKEKARIQKQRRLFREELNRHPKKSGDDDDSGGDGKRWGKKKKQAAGGGAQGSTAQP